MNLSLEKYQKIIGEKDTLKKLSVISGKSISEIDAMSIDELINVKKKCQPILEEKGYFKSCDYLSCYDTIFYEKPLSTMTLAEFIDGYHFIQNKDIVGVVILLFRVKEKFSEIGRDSWEEWGGYTEKRRKEFSQINWFEVKSAVESFYNFKDKILEKYYEQHEEDVDESILSEKEKRIVKEEIEKEKIQKQYIWENLLYQLSNGDITKFEAILDMPVVMVFNIINMKKTLKI